MDYLQMVYLPYTEEGKAFLARKILKLSFIKNGRLELPKHI